MDQSANSNQSGDDNPTLWSQQQALELWKYFDGMGATDKNTMVAVEAVLLGFLLATIAYVGATLLGWFQPVSITAPSNGISVAFGMVITVTELSKVISVALLGIVIAGVAAYVALLYGGYSNRNWAKAAAIASEQGKRYPKWEELPHKNWKSAVQTGKVSYLFTWATHFALPCDPNTELPPIFRMYTWLAIVGGGIHFLIIILSIAFLILRGKA